MEFYRTRYMQSFRDQILLFDHRACGGNMMCRETPTGVQTAAPLYFLETNKTNQHQHVHAFARHVFVRSKQRQPQVSCSVAT